MKTIVVKYFHLDVAAGAGQPFVCWRQLSHQQADLTETVDMQGEQQLFLMTTWKHVLKLRMTEFIGIKLSLHVQ